MESFLSMLAGWFMGLWTWLVELNGMLQVVLVLLCVVASGVCAIIRQTHGQPDDRGIRRTDLEPHAGDGHRVDRRRHPHADRGACHRRRVRAAARLRRLTLATPFHPGPAGKGFPRRSSHIGQESRNPKNGRNANEE